MILETYSLGDFNGSNAVCNQLDDCIEALGQLELPEATVAEIRRHAGIAAPTGSIKKAVEPSSYDADMSRVS